eukprot:1729913-Amphidinium_carterae.1
MQKVRGLCRIVCIVLNSNGQDTTSRSQRGAHKRCMRECYEIRNSIKPSTSACCSNQIGQCSIVFGVTAIAV